MKGLTFCSKEESNEMMFKISGLTAVLALAQCAFAGTFVTVKGAVNTPGDVPFREGMRVRDAVALAGGVSKQGDEMLVTVRSRDADRVVDLSRLGPTPLVEADSVIDVPVRDPAKYVSVHGAVSKPGYLQYKDGMTIKQALAEAKPFSTEKPNVIKITRTDKNGKKVTTVVDLEKLQASAEPVALSPGDYVEVAYPQEGFSNRELMILILIGILILIIAR
ncbi:MAG TPA: SLBB domain-containing protein [Fimbriimonadales bacterium]|jgi:protein involved in polysaccharide export with SLBB domain|nr:SLBB domain-containing protein [Fimbriimonadales bacterium]